MSHFPNKKNQVGRRPSGKRWNSWRRSVKTVGRLQSQGGRQTGPGEEEMDPFGVSRWRPQTTLRLLPYIGGVVCVCLLQLSGRSVDMHTVAQQVVGAFQTQSGCGQS